MEDAVRALFARYERVFESALRGEVDMDEVAGLYATAMIGASPAGVVAAADEQAVLTAHGVL